MKVKFFFNLFVLFVLAGLVVTACGGKGTATAASIPTAELTSTAAADIASTSTVETTSAAPVVDSGNANSCSFSGAWGNTHPAGRTQLSFQLQVEAGTLTVDRTGGGLPNAHIDGTFTYDAATNRIVMTNTAAQTSDPAFSACIGVAGTYSISFPDCTHSVLTLVSDTCGERVRWANGVTLNKQ